MAKLLNGVLKPNCPVHKTEAVVYEGTLPALNNDPTRERLFFRCQHSPMFGKRCDRRPFITVDKEVRSR